MDRAGQPFEPPMKGSLLVGATGRSPDQPAPKLRNVDCGMRIEKENSKIRNPQFEIRNSMGRCFLRRSSLPPGHNPSIPKMLNF
jgi:hypothetical protein